MKKLNLNKRTISQMDSSEMEAINGGDGGVTISVNTCLVSCPRGSRKGKECCGGGQIDILISIGKTIYKTVKEV